MRIAMFVAAMTLFSVVIAQPERNRSEPSAYFAASMWIHLPPGARVEYLAGVVDGMTVLAHVLGGDVRPTMPAISYQQAALMVYDRLLHEPDLQSRSIASVIADTLLGAHLTVVDPTGRVIEVEHRYGAVRSASR